MNTWETIEVFFADPLVKKIGIVLLGFFILFIVVRVLQKSLSRRIKDGGAKYKVRKGIGFAGYLMALFLLLVVFEVKLTGVTVALGVAGAGIAFALQEIIVSLAGYLSITVGRFYVVGDRIEMGGIKGDVIDIGAIRTTLMQVGDWVNGDLYNGKMVRIANSFVFKDPVFNYSGDFPFLWDELTVPIKTDVDYLYAEAEFKRILEEVVGTYSSHAQETWAKMTDLYRLENAQVNPMVTFVFDENWITFTLRYVVDFKKRRSTKHQLSKMILETIHSSNGRIAVASTSMEIVQVK